MPPEMLYVMGGVAKEFDFEKEGLDEFQKALMKALPQASVNWDEVTETFDVYIYGDDIRDHKWIKNGIKTYYGK